VDDRAVHSASQLGIAACRAVDLRREVNHKC